VSTLELRERLRAERTNLVSKIVERWKDVPPALLQQTDWRDSLYGYIGMQDHTLDPIIRPRVYAPGETRLVKSTCALATIPQLVRQPRQRVECAIAIDSRLNRISPPTADG
jgi:hypothetical protein